VTAPARHLIVMAKAPRLGRVKTRLALDVGAVAAAGFYRRTLENVTRRLTADPRWRTWLGVTPDRDIADDRLWPLGRHGPDRIAQGGGDLGRRMARLLAAVPPGPVVLVGADIPAIRPGHIWQAFRALGRNDAVLGPAADGGFWLVGLRHACNADIFAGVEWSRPDTLEKTLAGLPKGWRVGRAATLADVDDGAALKTHIGAAVSALGSRRETR
jgi:rSAM/selenodomain-associated transferase 1